VGTELTRRALDDYREAGDRTGEYRALAQLIRLFESQPGRLGEALEAWARLRESERWDLSARVRLWGEITSGLFYQSDRKAAHLQALQQRAADAGFAMLASTCRVRLSDRLLVDGDYEAVLEATDRDLEAWNLGPRLRSLMLCNRALAGVRLGRLELARQAARAAVRASPGVAFLVLESMALAATYEARWEDAALLAACAARLRHDRALQPDPAEAALIEDVKGALAQRLDAATLSELCRQGEAMPLQAGLARALSPAPEKAAATRGWPARAAAAAVPADPAS
jgi:tetratricopeptide (TPR) repeat protein